MRTDSADVQAEKRRRREEAIDALQRKATERGHLADRMFWTMVYDFEMAPWTTNRRQLEEIGFTVPPVGQLAPEEVSRRLRETVDALARLNVYLLHTDHLSDLELYTRLDREILDEEIRDIPACPGVREFIDLLGAYDEPERDLYLRHYANELERQEHAAEFGSVPPHEPPPYDRDRTLPTPEMEAWASACRGWREGPPIPSGSGSRGPLGARAARAGNAEGAQP